MSREHLPCLAPREMLRLQRAVGNATVGHIVSDSLGASQLRAVQRKAAPAASSASPATARSLISATPASGINKTGFVDNSDGANIRTGPAESGGKTVRDDPLPPATRVFVSGTHPAAPHWWYVTAFLEHQMFRGYVQDFRIVTELPEPSAVLYQVKEGDTAEGLAKLKFSEAVRDGHDLRYYENVLLYVNKGRAGVIGSYQDPGLLGGGANNVQLVAPHRIWLVSPAYARALESVVPDGSLTGGMVAKVKRFLGQLEDVLDSVTRAPDHLGEVAGEYAQAIRDHAAEIVGIVAGFLMAEALSALLASTGVGLIAAGVIQLALAAFGAAGMVEAGVQALQHGKAWLTQAWTAHGTEDKIAEASREFIRMLVSVAMAALSYAGVKANYAKALTIADSLPGSMVPAFAVAGGGSVKAGTGAAVATGVPQPAGPVGMAMTSATKGAGGGASAGKVSLKVARKAAELERRIEAVANRKLMSRLEKLDIASLHAERDLRALEWDVGIAEEAHPGMGELEPGLSDRRTPGKAAPKPFESGNFAHRYLELLRQEIGTTSVPKRFQARFAAGDIISVDKMPDGLASEVSLGDTARVDRLGDVIYEIKPNTDASIELGLEQVQEYVRLANAMKLGGRSNWTGRVVVYDAKAAAKYIP